MSKTRLRAGQVSIALIFSLTALAGTVPEFGPLPPLAHNVGAETGVQSFALADLDGDEIVDIVVIDADSEEVTAYLGDGDGTFDAGTLVGLADLPSAVAVADLTSPFETGGDVDGIVDVIVVDEIGSLQIFIGRGDGTFDEPDQSFDDLDTVEIFGVVAADFDGDDRDDLALLEGLDGVYFLCNDGGTLVSCATSVVFLDEFSLDLVDIDVGDFNGDGNLDVAAIDLDAGELYPIYGNGDGSFGEEVEPIVITETGEPHALRVGQVGGDDRDDIVVLSVDFSGDVPESTLTVLIASDGEGGFDRAVYPAGELGSALALADFDADGLPDVVTVGEDEFEITTTAAYLPGTAGGGFGAPVEDGLTAIAGGTAIESADLDGNGTADLVAVVNFGTELQAMLNGGDVPVVCPGDCNGNGLVAINELIIGVNIALGTADVSTCTAVDGNGNGLVAINELIAAVNSALDGCG